jgi:hypothetical protein
MPAESAVKNTMSDPNKSRNLRTALILLSIALVFFIGVIVNRVLFGNG